jgi:hypothetical protein
MPRSRAGITRVSLKTRQIEHVPVVECRADDEEPPCIPGLRGMGSDEVSRQLEIEIVDAHGASL